MYTRSPAADPTALDDTDRALALGLVFRRWPFAELPGELAPDRLRDLAARTARLMPAAERLSRTADASRDRLRADALALLDAPAPGRDG